LLEAAFYFYLSLIYSFQDTPKPLETPVNIKKKPPLTSFSLSTKKAPVRALDSLLGIAYDYENYLEKYDKNKLSKDDLIDA